eukprot:5646-Heterococcus_DN1.PRE.3
MFNEFPLAEIVHICAVKHSADMRIKLANYTLQITPNPSTMHLPAAEEPYAEHLVYSEYDSDAAVKFQAHKKRKPLINTTAMKFMTSSSNESTDSEHDSDAAVKSQAHKKHKPTAQAVVKLEAAAAAVPGGDFITLQVCAERAA